MTIEVGVIGGVPVSDPVIVVAACCSRRCRCRSVMRLLVVRTGGEGRAAKGQIRAAALVSWAHQKEGLRIWNTPHLLKEISRAGSREQATRAYLSLRRRHTARS